MKRNFRYITKFEEETRSARLETREGHPNQTWWNSVKPESNYNKVYDELERLAESHVSKSSQEGTPDRLIYDAITRFLAQHSMASEMAMSEKGAEFFHKIAISMVKKGDSTEKIATAMNKAGVDYYTKTYPNGERSSSARLEKRGYGLKATDVIGYAWEGELLTVEFVKHLFKTKQVEFDADSLKGRKDMNGIPEGLTYNGEEYMPIFGSTELDESDRKMLEEGRSSSARLETRMASKPQPRSDKESEREIFLTVTNDSDKESGRLKSIIENLARKVNKQNYDKALASKLYAYLVEDGIKSYTKEFGKGSISLSPASRLAIGAELEEYYVDDVDAKANQLAGIDPQQGLIDAESKRLDWKQNSSSTRLKKRGWFGGDDEDEEEEKQPMSNNDAREEVRLYIMNTQGIYSAWMSMVDDACKQWLRTHDKEDDAPTFRDVVDDFTEIVRLGINEMNKVIHDDSENSEFPENNFSMADIKWIFEHSSAQEDLDEKWDWRKE